MTTHFSGKTPRAELLKQFEQLNGAPAPPGVSVSLLSALIAYETQAARKGGLPSRVRKQLQLIATGASPPAAAPSLRQGSRLVRDWNGKAHVVDVGKGTFVYNGQSYRSLSAIAREITGARWSGPRFFGLRSPE